MSFCLSNFNRLWLNLTGLKPLWTRILEVELLARVQDLLQQIFTPAGNSLPLRRGMLSEQRHSPGSVGAGSEARLQVGSCNFGSCGAAAPSRGVTAEEGSAPAARRAALRGRSGRDGATQQLLLHQRLQPWDGTSCNLNSRCLCRGADFHSGTCS